MCITHIVLNREWAREQKVDGYSRALWLVERWYMSVHSGVWEWGGSLKRDVLRKFWSLKRFDQLWLGRVGLLVELEVNNSSSSNSSEWVPSTGFQDLEHSNRRKGWSSLHSCFLNFHEADSGFKMEHWSFVFVFVFGTCCCALCVLLSFSLWGPHGKELLNSFLCELPLCPCIVPFLS